MARRSVRGGNSGSHGNITGFEDISLRQSSTAHSNIQGDGSGNSGSHNMINSGNANSGNTISGNTTNNYYGATNPTSRDAEILQCLYTSSYRSHLGRVREPAAGTCTWVTEHPKYKDWLRKKTGLLWLSADPGCGKSVITAFLANHLKLRTDTIVCYFFFKDDSEEQRSPTFALCAILHQLFTQRGELCKYAEQAFNSRGKRLAEDVDTLWDILVRAVGEGRCGEVICVVDALDECDESTLPQLTGRLNRLAGSKNPDIPLKFLVTGRPYHRIERDLNSRVTTIRLRGEDEVSAISTDVTRVINEAIGDLELSWKRPGGFGYLREILESCADRTFLWVSLILEILKDSVDDSRESFTDLVSTAPRDLPDLYTKILNKSSDPNRARRILHIVVAAIRPLTLHEINIAFRTRRGHTTIRDLGDFSPGNETTVKNLCGLFVRIIDSRVYLVHQTAREFLVKGASAGRGEWQYTLCPIDSNLILADICISYLSLQDFENDPIVVDAEVNDIDNYFQKYLLFFDYAARHWADHFRDSRNRQMELFEATRTICELRSNRFLAWLDMYWRTTGWYYPFPNDFTHLMIASWLGQQAVVERLLTEGDINTRSVEYGTALNVAALKGDGDIVKTLVKRGVNAYLNGREYNIFFTWNSVRVNEAGGRKGKVTDLKRVLGAG